MNIFGPTAVPRLNEVVGVVLLFAVVFLTLSLVSYYPQDPSWNTSAGTSQTRNLIGRVGSHLSDLVLQGFGLGAFLLPLYLLVLAWKWIRSTLIRLQGVRLLGLMLFQGSACVMLTLGPEWRLFDNSIPPGGLLGLVLAQALVAVLNVTGSVLAASAGLLVSIYLISSFQMSRVPDWFVGPAEVWRRLKVQLGEWRAHRSAAKPQKPRRSENVEAPQAPLRTRVEFVTEPAAEFEIPIRTLDDTIAPPSPPAPEPPRAVAPEPEPAFVEYTPPPSPFSNSRPAATVEPSVERRSKTLLHYDLPSTELLNEPEGRNPYDAQELKDTASRIKAKFEEFNVLGSVVQINPGPVVTTFEFKPEAGIKYSRITTLTEDLCLGLQAESILIERIPGKPTVGIEVPNSRRELISLRQILESEEFQGSHSKMTIAVGKDISGRIKVAALEAMPHLLIAGSTGSGKSVMLNSLIMSVLYKATPNDVRMILVDPKRVEMGIYEGIPHLLTPVITDPRKATYALRNAVLEMERRLKLLASHGVRNIDQFNKKVRQLLQTPRNLFADDTDDAPADDLQPLPYILIVIDELADLMMLERANVEESITRLAQMARAVGMHLVVATQRPSVDVITGLIKANFPARISFRVATRVDSRTILDVMGAEHLLGKGDMLFLPPGSARLQRLHAPYVSENETNGVVASWKDQAQPDYDQSFLLAPPSDEDEGADAVEDGEMGSEDPAYQDAVRVVCEVGKASTSILQRRLRLGYGRAARLLDVMQREGIIGPPDGSRPREVLRRPEWVREVPDEVG
jgi:S-DNA-T family DNA segregation ATPase FtsK/SpoIIIE